MNSYAIASAIAAQFVGATATVGSVTETLAAGDCTALLPNSIAKGPVLVVFPPSGTLDVGVGRMRDDEYDFPVRLFRDPVDFPTRTAWAYAWIDGLRDRVEMNMDLDLAYVSWAQPVSLAVLIDTADWYGGQMDTVELTVRVKVAEVVTTAAI